jgi:AhpD family alkylhydroperoxidase
MKWKNTNLLKDIIKIMQERLSYAKVSRDALKGMPELEKYVAASGIERPLYELFKTRASQINGCAYCLDMVSDYLKLHGWNVIHIMGIEKATKYPYTAPARIVNNELNCEKELDKD